jgi:hypothetical protein
MLAGEGRRRGHQKVGVFSHVGGLWGAALAKGCPRPDEVKADGGADRWLHEEEIQDGM